MLKKDGFINISYQSVCKITRQTILNNLKIVVKKYAKGNLIDLGCGIKPYEKLFKDYIESYFGVDYQPSTEANYKELTKADLFTDCSNTGLEKETFDTLLSTQVAEHIYDTRKFINECFRLLKNGGIAILTIPFVWQLHAEPYDYYRFTKFSLEQIFKESGFQIIELLNTEGAFATVIQTKIISIYNRHISNLFLNRINKIINFIRIPISNFFALKFDKYFYNDKLCLNYLIVAKKN